MSPRLFLDANIFFAAVASTKGGSYFLLDLGAQGHVEIITTAYALAEAERNITRKISANALLQHYENLQRIEPHIQSLAGLPVLLEQRLLHAVSKKDIPIVAGALLSESEYLITLDRKHLLDNEQLAALRLSLAIVTPGDFLQSYRPQR